MYPLHVIVIPVITAAKCLRTDCCIQGGKEKKRKERKEKKRKEKKKLGILNLLRFLPHILSFIHLYRRTSGEYSEF